MSLLIRVCEEDLEVGGTQRNGDNDAGDDFLSDLIIISRDILVDCNARIRQRTSL